MINYDINYIVYNIHYITYTVKMKIEINIVTVKDIFKLISYYLGFSIYTSYYKEYSYNNKFK